MSNRGGNSGHGSSGNNGTTSLDGTVDDDTLNGGNGKDLVHGNDGNDTISGGNGMDSLFGDAGDDVMSGGNGNDKLDGGDGNDTLNGGIGHDILTGGLGADTFVFDGNALKGGSDTITDFVPTVTTTTTTTDPDTGETTTTTTTTVNDVLDIHSLLHGFDPLTSNLADFVQLTENNGNTVVMVNTGNGAHAHFQAVATLEGVTGLDAATMLAAGNLITQ